MSYYRSLIETVKSYLTNLVGYYPFNANVNDFSGNSYNGTVTGTVTYTTGKVSNAINLQNNTATNFITIPDNNDFSFTDLTNDTKFSISIWVFVTFFSTNGNYIFNKRGATAGVNNEYQFQVNANGSLFFARHSLLSNANGQTFTSPTSVIPLNTWKNIVITSDGTSNINNLQIYIDGTLQTLTRTSFGTGFLRFGNGAGSIIMGKPSSFTDSTFKHRGLLDEFYIWKGRELTATEALDVYTKGNAGTALI